MSDSRVVEVVPDAECARMCRMSVFEQFYTVYAPLLITEDYAGSTTSTQADSRILARTGKTRRNTLKHGKTRLFRQVTQEQAVDTGSLSRNARRDKRSVNERKSSVKGQHSRSGQIPKSRDSACGEVGLVSESPE